MPEERPQITANDLKAVKQGFIELIGELETQAGARGFSGLTLRQLAIILRKSEALAAKVGGIGVLADCAETLQDLQGG